MIDVWTTKSPKGKTVTFRIEGDRKSGFVYAAQLEDRDIDEIDGSLKELTREEVEKHFADYVAEK